MSKLSGNQFNNLSIFILNKLKNTNENNPITSKQLCKEYKISFRLLKQIITRLREDYPIVSKETNGGGYWLATTNREILNFTNMIEARKKGYEDTINKMIKFII